MEEEENVVFSFSKVKAAKKKDKKGGAVTSSPVSKENRTLAGSWLNSENAERYALLAEEKEVKAFPQQYMDELAAMKQYLKVVQAGVLIGEVKGKDLSPAHALAMSASLLRQDAFDTEEVSYKIHITREPEKYRQSRLRLHNGQFSLNSFSVSPL